jgi:hypothetical protein
MALLVLLCALPAWAQTHAPDAVVVVTRVALAESVVAAVVDLAVTEYGIGAGQFREANPMLRRFDRQPTQMGIAKGVMVVVPTYIVLRLMPSHPKWALVTALSMAAVNTYVATRNTQLLGSRR